MIEHVDDGTNYLRMSPVRQNHRRLILFRGSEVIWEADKIAPLFPNPKISDPQGAYYNTTWQTILDASE